MNVTVFPLFVVVMLRLFGLSVAAVKLSLTVTANVAVPEPASVQCA